MAFLRNGFHAAGLMLIAAALHPAAYAQDHSQHDHTAYLTVPKMCCGKESTPAVKELMRLPGVKEVVPDHKAHVLAVVPKPGMDPSPKAIWEAVERINLAPAKLVTAHGVYTKKPIR